MKIEKIEKYCGELSFAGDKSISHRALIFAAMASGKSEIANCSLGEDVRSTRNCLAALQITFKDYDNKIEITGKGIRGFCKPAGPLNAGNSGTTSRLLMGLLSAQAFNSTIYGDESLSLRPMLRVVNLLEKAGAKIKANPKGMLPVLIEGNLALTPFSLETIVPSAQVKSALALYALHCDTPSFIVESELTRDHTERMLNLNVCKESGKRVIEVSSRNYPYAQNYFVPGDVSSAAFFVVAALITPNSEIYIKNVSLNPTRIEYLNVLKAMGGNIKIEQTGNIGAETYGNIEVKSSSLKNIDIDSVSMPLIIDEIPILSVAGFFASGDFKIFGAKELRIKESDRISALCNNFKILGAEIEEYEDGFSLSHKITNLNPIFDSYLDHRIAMSFSILAANLPNGAFINGFGTAAISNPIFLGQMNSLTSYKLL